MDQIRIGRFIAGKRKEHGLTQMQLAEALGITDRAVSKWETGRSLPDASIMLDLCGMLGITVNDLLCGEMVSMDNYNEAMEKSLLEMVRQKETSDRRLLKMEIVIVVLSMVFLFALVAAGAVSVTLQMKPWIFWLLFGIGLVQFLVCAFISLRIEQAAGYYECGKCGHRYVPSYLSVNLAMHMGRTRYMKCPACGHFSWQKKVLSMDEGNEQ